MQRPIILDAEAQNALLAVNAVNDFDSFGRATENLVRTVLPGIVIRYEVYSKWLPISWFLKPKELLSAWAYVKNVAIGSFPQYNLQVKAITYVLNPATNELEYSTQVEIDGKERRKLSSTVLTRYRAEDRICSISKQTERDSLQQLVPEVARELSSESRVYFWPVAGNGRNVVVVSVIVTFTMLSEQELLKLDFFEKQISVNYLNLLRRSANEKQNFCEAFGGVFEKSFALLSQRIILYLQEITEASSGVILAVDHASEELYHKVKSSDGTLVEKRIELVSTFFEEIVKTGSQVNVHDISAGLTYKRDLIRLTETNIHSLLCMPVVHSQTKDVFCIVCLFNEKTTGSFSPLKEEKVCSVCDYFSARLFNALEWEKELVLRRQQEHLLNVAKNLFIHLDDVTVLLTEILQEARNLTQAEICSLFLVDKERQEIVAKVFNHSGGDGEKKNEMKEVRMPLGQGIAGHVAETGVLLNIKDAYSHPLFCSSVDKETGFKTRNILCFPIKDEKEVIGVGQLVNKLNGPAFTRFDEDLTKAFAIFCGISICHSLLYKKVIDAQHRDKITNELMIYHMKVTPKDVQYYLSEKIPKPHDVHPAFADILFRPRLIHDVQCVKACISMFEDMDLINKWKIPYETLIKFTLMVKKGYRDLPYHNWTHAFTVAHFCYLLYKNLSQISSFRDMEILALFVSCLCHDLDHRGTNNAFQVSYNSVLAALYSSEGSVMERHHFAQTCCILSTEGCNIFENLTREEYHEIMDLTRKIILATDLSHHFKILKDLKKLARDGYNSSDATHRELLLYLMMTSCDLSDQVKPFDSASTAADLVYTEFFSQGDLEKAMGNKPSEMMDRERACVPKLQIDFIDSIVFPSYRLLADIFSELEVLCTVINENREQWKQLEASGEYRKFEIPRTYSAPLSPLPQLEKYKIERKLNALQLCTSPDYAAEESKANDHREDDLWRQANGDRDLESCAEKKFNNESAYIARCVSTGHPHLIKQD